MTSASAPGFISIHNESLYHSFMNRPQTYSHTKHTANRRSTTESKKQRLEDLKRKKRDSKRKRILEYHGEIEKWRQENLKQTLQRMEWQRNREESELKKRLNLIESRGGVYNEVAHILHKHESQHAAKTHHLYTDWRCNVFDPIKQQTESVANDEQYMTRRKDKMRNLYAKYLEQCNKNGKKIFLDSINEQEYDPFEWTHDTEMAEMQQRKRKQRNSKINDPLKSDLNKYIAEQKISQNNHDRSRSNAKRNELTFSLKPHTRFCFPPLQYNQVSHLPLFRDLQQLERTQSKCILPSHIPGGNVLLNQHDISKPNAKVTAKLLRQEYFPQTKRIVRPEFTKYEFKLSEMW